MTVDLLRRAQDLLESTQKRIGKNDERLLSAERQIIHLSQRVRELESHLTILRAETRHALELARRTSGDHGHSGE